MGESEGGRGGQTEEAALWGSGVQVGGGTHNFGGHQRTLSLVLCMCVSLVKPELSPNLAPHTYACRQPSICCPGIRLLLPLKPPPLCAFVSDSVWEGCRA